MRKLMDLIPTLDKEISIEEIAQEVDLSSNDVLTYLAKWEEKKLVTLI